MMANRVIKVNDYKFIDNAIFLKDDDNYVVVYFKHIKEGLKTQAEVREFLPNEFDIEIFSQTTSDGETILFGRYYKKKPLIILFFLILIILFICFMTVFLGMGANQPNIESEYVVDLTELPENEIVTLDRCVDANQAYFNIASLNNQSTLVNLAYVDVSNQAGDFVCDSLENAELIQVQYDSVDDEHVNAWVFIDSNSLQQQLVEQGYVQGLTTSTNETYAKLIDSTYARLEDETNNTYDIDDTSSADDNLDEESSEANKIEDDTSDRDELDNDDVLTDMITDDASMLNLDALTTDNFNK